MRRIFFLATILATLYMTATSRADWDDRPGFDFHPQVSADAPCGVGTPPRGHFPSQVSPTTLPQGLKINVEQDAHRLCYVVGNVAEAPVIRIRQGADFSVTLKNDITDPAAITNYVAIGHLDLPNKAVPAQSGFYPVVPGMHHVATGVTNIHVHGFAVPPVAPQDETLKTCADPAVGPAVCGHREVTYHYHVPANMPAGLYWYHPHVHGEVQAQMLMGLSGAIVVEGPEDDARRATGILDRIFIVRQSQDLDVAGQPIAPAARIPDIKVSAPAPASPAPPQEMRMASSPAPGVTGDAIDTADELGCSSNTGTDQITLNGSKVLDGEVQDSDLAPVQMAAGTTQLWRVLNAATDAFLDLAVIDENGKTVPIGVIARDGAPLTDDSGNRLPATPTTESQLVAPAGRVEFLISAPPVGRKYYFVTHAVDTGCAGDKVPERCLALVTAAATATAVVAAAPQAVPPLPVSEPDYFTGLLARKTDRERTFDLAEYPRPGSDDQTDFYIMEHKPGEVLRPFEMDGPPLITVTAGATEEWVIENWTNELHAFHIHQVHFRVLSIDGTPIPNPPLLDVFTVPYAKKVDAGGGKQKIVPGRIRIKLAFPEEFAGDIPFHCHLVDHEDNGMMAVLRVLPKKTASISGSNDSGNAPAPSRTAATGQVTPGPFTLTDQNGDKRGNSDFNGKYQLIYFGYSFCPDLCPTTLAVMAQALDKMGMEAKRIVPVFVTIDPERDTPAVLKEYVAAFGPRFVGLTGTQAEIAAVERQYRVYARKEPPDGKGNYGMEHSSIIYLMGPDGRLVASYDQLISPDMLEKDLRAKMGSAGASSPLSSGLARR